MSSLEQRVADLERQIDATIPLKQLPLAALKRKLTSDLQPDARTFLLPASVTADALSTDLMQGRICTSTTRPADPYVGLMIYETDTNQVFTWDGAAWSAVAP